MNADKKSALILVFLEKKTHPFPFSKTWEGTFHMKTHSSPLY